MKAANMRAQLVAQIAGQVAAGMLSDHENYTGNIVEDSVATATLIVDEVERRLSEPIYKDRSWESQEQS